mgnify:CR=1 FL=1
MEDTEAILECKTVVLPITTLVVATNYLVTIGAGGTMATPSGSGPAPYGYAPGGDGSNSATRSAASVQNINARKTAMRRLLLEDDAICMVRIPTGENVNTMTTEDAATKEAAVVADIMYTYLNNYKRTGLSEEDRAAKAMASVLIVTPHHIQRRAVSNRLEAVLEHMDHMDVNNMFVSTAEKAQGKTSMLVVVCYTVLSEAHLEKDAAFLLKHSRLNVALSRARSKVIIVCGGSVLENLRIKLLDEEVTRDGFELYSHAVDQSMSFASVGGGIEDAPRSLQPSLSYQTSQTSQEVVSQSVLDDGGDGGAWTGGGQGSLEVEEEEEEEEDEVLSQSLIEAPASPFSPRYSSNYMLSLKVDASEDDDDGEYEGDSSTEEEDDGGSTDDSDYMEQQMLDLE